MPTNRRYLRVRDRMTGVVRDIPYRLEGTGPFWHQVQPIEQVRRTEDVVMSWSEPRYTSPAIPTPGPVVPFYSDNLEPANATDRRAFVASPPDHVPASDGGNSGFGHRFHPGESCGQYDARMDRHRRPSVAEALTTLATDEGYMAMGKAMMKVQDDEVATLRKVAIAEGITALEQLRDECRQDPTHGGLVKEKWHNAYIAGLNGAIEKLIEVRG